MSQGGVAGEVEHDSALVDEHHAIGQRDGTPQGQIELLVRGSSDGQSQGGPGEALVLDQGLLMSAIVEDIVKRPFITIGMVALLLLIALAVTSTHGMRRRMGRRWQTLHNSVYVIAVLGVWHFWWQVKLDTLEPLIYAVILTILLGYRLTVYLYRRR